MGILRKLKQELFGNERISSKTIRRYKISFEELTSLLNTNDQIISVEISEDEKTLLIETQSKR
jgi:hypothetical protein